MAVSPLVRPSTSTGTELSVVEELFPSSPLRLSPQHWAPPFTIAQVCSPPAAMAVTPLVRPSTSTGTRLFAAKLFPSSPLPLSPQHWARPFTTAQVWPQPAAMAVTPLVRPSTSTGTRLVVEELLPS